MGYMLRQILDTEFLTSLFRRGIEIYNGIPEANDKNEAMYGLERLTGCLNDNREKSGKELLNTVIADVDEFAVGAGQFDDMTSVLLEINKD